MKKLLLIMMLGVFTLGISAQNLVLNPGFEDWDDATSPTSWTKAENCEQEQGAANVHSGLSSVKHTGDGTKDLSQTFTVEAGKKYSLTIWYKNEGGDGTDCRIWSNWVAGATNLTDDAALLKGPDNGYFTSSTEWASYTTIVTAPATADAFYFEVRTYSGAITYWDDFVFEEYVDVVPPVVTFEPTDGESGVSVSSDITLSFDEAVLNADGSELTDPASLLVLKETDAAGADVAFTASINAEKNIITITPDANLSYTQAYYVALNASSVEDADGNELDVLQSATFTTMGPLELTFPVGGEVFHPDQGVTITWNTDLTDNLTIWSSMDNGVTWEPMIEDLDPTLGTIDFTVPTDAENTQEAKLRIALATDLTFTGVIDESDAFSVVPVFDIKTIQGTTDEKGNSEYADTTCLVAGVVTFTNGTNEYYIADGTGDYSGIAVRDEVNKPNVGDSILIAGAVEEYYSLTQMKNLFHYEVVTTGEAVPAAIEVTTGGAGEALEGVIVKISSAVVVEATNSYGETEVDDGSGVILIDDVYFAPELNLGGTYDITGPLSYSYSKFRIYPTSASDVSEILSSVATVSSEVYTVDNDLETITGVPFSTDLASFKANIVPAYGATFDVFDSDGTTLATELVSDCKLIVTSQDESASKTYVITKDPKSSIATVSSMVYTVDDDAGTIVGVLYKSTVASFEALLLPAAGATLSTFESDGTTAASDLVSGCKLIVTAEDGTSTKTYEITVDDAMPLDLIFSEYIEGSGNNKAIELFNPNDVAVKLDYYQIAQISNGGDDWEYFHVFPQGSVLNSNETYVLITDETDAELFAPANADEVLSYPSVVHHNGDDARGLVVVTAMDTTLVDIIGEIGEDPGSGWAVAGIADATKDHTLVRKGTVLEGNTDWTASAGTNADDSEWIVKDQNFFDSLGVHTMLMPEPSDDASITDLLVGGVSVDAFSPAQLSYAVTLAAGTTTPPVVTVVTTDDMAEVEVTDATDLSGDEAARTTTVVITAEDGETTKTYTVVFSLDVSVQNNLFSNVKVYPIPSSSSLHIDNIDQVDRIAIYDITGATVMNLMNTGESSVILDISSFNSGVYLVKMTSNDTSGVVRFIKE